MNEPTRSFKGIWIPAEIWLNKNLTLIEKVFLVEIDSLDNDEGCFASNDYFSNFFGLSKNRCSEVIKSLEKKTLVNISYVYKPKTKLIEKRVIKVLDKSNIGIRNSEGDIRNLDRGYSENCEDNNTVFNNTNNNIFSNTQSSAVVDTNIEFIESKTHLKLTKNMKKIVQSWDKERLSKSMELFTLKGGKYFSLLEKIYKDDGNFLTDNSIDSKNTNYAMPTNKFRNFDETFTQYESNELDEIIAKGQAEKWKDR